VAAAQLPQLMHLQRRQRPAWAACAGGPGWQRGRGRAPAPAPAAGTLRAPRRTWWARFREPARSLGCPRAPAPRPAPAAAAAAASTPRVAPCCCCCCCCLPPAAPTVPRWRPAQHRARARLPGSGTARYGRATRARACIPAAARAAFAASQAADRTPGAPKHCAASPCPLPPPARPPPYTHTHTRTHLGQAQQRSLAERVQPDGRRRAERRD
jgi:hypothetical protein